MTPSKHICFIWKALFYFSHILPSCFALSSETMKNNMHTIFFEQSFLFWKSHWTSLGLFCWCNTLFIVNNWSTRRCKVMGLFSVYNLYYLLFTIYNTLYIVNNWSTRQCKVGTFTIYNSYYLLYYLLQYALHCKQLEHQAGQGGAVYYLLSTVDCLLSIYS